MVRCCLVYLHFFTILNACRICHIGVSVLAQMHMYAIHSHLFSHCFLFCSVSLCCILSAIARLCSDGAGSCSLSLGSGESVGRGLSDLRFTEAGQCGGCRLGAPRLSEAGGGGVPRDPAIDLRSPALAAVLSSSVCISYLLTEMALE